MNVTIQMTEAQARMALGEVQSKCDTLKNCIASAVERGLSEYGGTGQHGYAYASKLVEELRETEKVFAAINGAILRANGTIK